MLGSTAAPAQTITVTVSCSENGEIAPKGTLVLPANASISITATPNTGYEIYDWYVNGQPAGWTVNNHTFNYGDLDFSVHVLFTRITNLVHSTVGPNGKLSPDATFTPLAVGWGDSVTFTATPDAHYHVDNWTLDNGSGSRIVQTGGNSYTLANIRAEGWVTVSFAPDTYIIQADGNGHGALSPTGAVAVVYGENQSFTAMPERGCELVVWSVDGRPVLTNSTSYIFLGVETNHTLAVTFSAPQLAIALTPTNTVLLTWPDSLASYTLQENSEARSSGWIDSSANPKAVNGRWQAVAPRLEQKRYYRLFLP